MSVSRMGFMRGLMFPGGQQPVISGNGVYLRYPRVADFAAWARLREESRDVYQLFVERNARASTIVTSNRDTQEWLAVFDDTLPVSDGLMEVGTRVPLDKLRSAIEDWFRRKSYIKKQDHLIVTES